MQAQITAIIRAIPFPKRGALRDRHERWVRDAVDATLREDDAHRCGRRSRVVLTPRRWCRACRDDDLAGDGGKKARFTGESTKETVKTTAQGMSVDATYLWWTYSCVFYFCTRGHGCGPRTRHSLRPLFGAGTLKARACHVARTRLYVLCHCKRKRSNPALDCFAACAPVRKRFAFVAGNDLLEDKTRRVLCIAARVFKNPC